MPSCCAFGCTNRTSSGIKGITFHRFPREEKRRAQWIIAIRRKDWLPTQASVLCSEHFSEDQFDRTSTLKVFLKEAAIPTIFKGFPAHLQEMLNKKEKKKTKSKVVNPSEQVEDSFDTKKPSMKTAIDVISRLLWDDSLPQERFTVGYIDRFDGIVEKPFTSLDWSDPAVVDNHSLALPKHRIQYFKYRNRKVWDKTTRLDVIFGSTGSSFNIHDFMIAVDDERLNFCDEALILAKKNISLDNSDIESEDEYDTSGRANFFVAARVKTENTVKNLKKVSDYMKSRDEVIGQCCILPQMYHLTLCILKLDSPSDVADAVAAIKRVASKNLPVVTLNLEGLDHFHQRVLYARVEKNEDLYSLRKHLVDELVSSTITDKFSFVPHVTVAKLSRPVCRIRNSKFIDQYLYLKFEDDNFGSEVITDLYLCEMGEARSDDGFYKCACEVSLSPDIC